MVDENSLGPLGPNIISIESVSDLIYSVRGNGFGSGIRVEVRNAVGQQVDGVSLRDASGTAFTLTLPFATPGPYTLVVINPDGRTSTAQFATPGTSGSNDALRADS
ncbi:MAG TPA: hypothetical protein VKV02_11000 [Acidobacteriaceae bacterium]|nr:hypothetical protein [Acidobacteriaceae bacterium]